MRNLLVRAGTALVLVAAALGVVGAPAVATVPGASPVAVTARVDNGVDVQVAPRIRLGRIQYDAPGHDTALNVNGEYVVVRNIGGTPYNVTGWTVRNRAGDVYTFPAYVIPAGSYAVVRTGVGVDTPITRYWGLTRHVWGNDADAATLRSAVNATIDVCRWASAGDGYVNC